MKDVSIGRIFATGSMAVVLGFIVFFILGLVIWMISENIGIAPYTEAFGYVTTILNAFTKILHPTAFMVASYVVSRRKWARRGGVACALCYLGYASIMLTTVGAYGFISVSCAHGHESPVSWSDVAWWLLPAILCFYAGDLGDRKRRLIATITTIPSLESLKSSPAKEG